MTGLAGVFRVRAEPHPLQREPLDHELLLGERLGIELEQDAVGLDQVPARLKRIGHLQGAQVHRRLLGQQIEPADVHLRPQQLGAHLFGGLPRHRLGEEDDQDGDDREDEQQRADGLPAENLDVGHQFGRKSLYQL